ncbi:MAG: alkaline phosphatase family protein [Verrucomicrobiota bacterium]
MRSDHRLLLVGLDGLDWALAGELARAGSLPFIDGVLRRSSGGLLRGLPYCTAAGWWTSAATGVWPHEHGSVGRGRIEAASGVVHPHTAWTRMQPAFWNILKGNGKRCHVVGWPGAQPAEAIDGYFLTGEWVRSPPPPGSTDPLPGAWTSPADLARALGQCRARVEELDPGILGFFVDAAAAGAELAAEPLVGHLLRELAALYTCHNTAMAILEDAREGAEPWQVMAVHYAFPEEIHRAFGKFRSPQTREDPRQHRLFNKVVEGSIRLMDLLLADLVNGCGPETTLLLVSARTHPPADAAAPEPTLLGPPPELDGRVYLSGRGIRAGARPHQARVTDIAPTLLHFLGCDIPTQMAGRPWVEVQRSPREVTRVPYAGAPACPVGEEPAADAADRVLDGGDLEAALCAIEFETGVSLIAAGEPARAVGPFARAMVMRPEHPQYGYHLAFALLACGLRGEALEAMAGLADLAGGDPAVGLHVAGFAMRCGDFQNAGQILDHPANRQDEGGEHRAEWLLLKALLLNHQGQCVAAEAACREALARKPGMAQGWLGLANVLLSQERFSDAEDAARQALRRLGSKPDAHWVMAHAAAHDGRFKAVLRHAAMAIRGEPGQADARRWLTANFSKADPALRSELMRVMKQAGHEGAAHGKHPGVARRHLAEALHGPGGFTARTRVDAWRANHEPLVRAAGVTEFDRVDAFLEIQRPAAGAYRRRFLAVCGKLQRIVAAAVVEAAGTRGMARLHLKLRPAHQQQALVERLLEHAVVEARAEGHTSMAVVLPETDGICPWMESAGFLHVRTDSWWLASDLERVRVRLQKATDLCQRLALSGHGIESSALTGGDFPEIQEILRVHQLVALRNDTGGHQEPRDFIDLTHSGQMASAEGEAGCPAATDYQGYDPLLSCVLRVDGRIAGVQLVQRLSADSIFVHARAVHPDYMKQSGLLNLHFYGRLIGGEWEGVKRCLFSGQVGKADETHAMARRFAAAHLGTFRTMRKDLT